MALRCHWMDWLHQKPLFPGKLDVVWMARPLPVGSAQGGKEWDCGRAVRTFTLGDDDMQLGLCIIMVYFSCKFISLFLHLTLSLYVSIISG